MPTSREPSTAETPAVPNPDLHTVLMVMRDLQRGMRDLAEKVDTRLGEMATAMGAHDRALERVAVLDKRGDDHEARLRAIETSRAADLVAQAGLSTRVAIYGAIGGTVATILLGSIFSAIVYALTHLSH